MKATINARRSTIIISIIISCVFVLTQCIDRRPDKPVVIKNFSGRQFAGSVTCASCHQSIYERHIHTAHYLSSRPATGKFIKGSFESGKNSYAFDYARVVTMEKRDSDFYQVEYIQGIEKRFRRFDIAIGSGTKGQSYLSWVDNQLFQLPITYFTAANEWSNSPGYPDRIVFNRPITSRCLECHSTFAKTISAPGITPEKFARNQMIYGIDCEKCHGPAARHVEFQSQHSSETKGLYIVNPASLSRQLQLDACALCHGGKLQKRTPSFQFTAGNHLSDYFTYDTAAPNPDNIDVHGNQYGLLRASKCFRMSETMTCNTCHNTHEKERGKTALFSQRCMSCHNTEHGSFCKLTSLPASLITSNCIDCHMPVKPSRLIAVHLQGRGDSIAADLIRSHFISIYPDETKKVITGMKRTP